MLFDTLRFGMVEIDEKKVLSFSEGIPGLEEYKRFVILQFEESYPIIWMQSLDDRGICLPMIDTFLVLPSYSFDLADEDRKDLELNKPEELQIISVLVIPEQIDRMTMNLVAPILINIRTGKAKQVILNGDEYNVRYPVFEDIRRLLKEEDADAGAVEKSE